MTATALYRWTSDSSIPVIDRARQRARILEVLLRGDGAVLYGGRGMGKSYLIRQLRDDLSAIDDVTTLYLTPDTLHSVDAYLDQLISALGLAGPIRTVSEAVETWLGDNRGRRLVLLYDEVDGYVRGTAHGARLFDALEGARKAAAFRLGILAAGGLGLVEMGRSWSSTFTSRAQRFFAERFDRAELVELAEPLRLSEPDPVLDTLYAHSGGIPALSVAGMRGLLEAAERTPRQVVSTFETFTTDHADYIQLIWTALGEESSVDAPARLWRALRRDASIDDVETLQAQLKAISRRQIDQGLDILQAAGLVEVGRRVAGRTPIALVPSILSLPDPGQATRHDTLREQLRDDLVAALRYIRRWGSTSFIREGVLMPEAVFQTAILITLASRGWEHVTQESEQGAGRIDVRASHPHHDGHVIIEVKRWPENDYKDIQDQVESYRDDETAAMATVMISLKQALDADEFNQTCFANDATPVDGFDPLILLERTSLRADGPSMPIDHFLLKLARRR